jgi:hypothetical protein
MHIPGLARVGFVTALLAGSMGCEAAQCSLAGLSWMAGNWQNASNPQGAQERWVIAPDNVLMGSAFEFPPGKAGYAELMTVRQEGDALSMVLRHFDGGLRKAWEEREAPMIFNASSCDSRSAVFDGQGSHVGEHLTYKRAGKKLRIIGDFLHQGKPDHEEWAMILKRD